MSLAATVSRRSPYQRIHGIEPQDRKGFRLCIPRFLDAKKWPAHISVSHSIFNKKSSQSEDVHDAASSNNGRSNAVGLSTAETASACHKDAMSAAGIAEPRPSASSRAELLPTGDNADMDDTIIMDSNDQ